MIRIDAEAAVLGGCLIDPQAYWRVADMLTADDFASAENRAIFGTISKLCRDGVVPDYVTVGESLPSVPMSHLAELANNTPGASNVRGYAGWITQAATERKVQAAGARIAKLKGIDAVGEAQRIIGACAPRMTDGVKPVREFLRESVVRMQERCDATGELSGVPSGIPKLDELTAGWQRGDLIILAARPSVGKTAFALQAALHAAQSGVPVLFLSLEMTGSQLADRALSHLGRVSSVSIREPNRMDEADWSRVTAAGAALEKLPLLIDESSALTVDAICARVRQCDAGNRLGLVVIDYLTQITPPRAESMTEAIQAITRQLKALAKEIQVPIILLSQLNREGENKPSLSSLRSSGAIEQDADIVAFLHRPDANNRELIQFLVEKQRNGPTGDFYLDARMDVMRFDTSEWTAPVTAANSDRGFSGYKSRARA